jgi:hypothetical protein
VRRFSSIFFPQVSPSGDETGTVFMLRDGHKVRPTGEPKKSFSAPAHSAARDQAVAHMHNLVRSA